MEWLISYNLYHNRSRADVKRTEIIDVEPSKWWDKELWRDDENRDEYEGCIVTMVHAIPDDDFKRPLFVTPIAHFNRD